MSFMLYFLCAAGVIMLFHVLSVMLGFLKVNIFVVTPAKGQNRHFLTAFLFAAKSSQETNQNAVKLSLFSIFAKKMDKTR